MVPNHFNPFGPWPTPSKEGGAASTSAHNFTLCPVCPSSETILLYSPSLGDNSTRLRTLSGRPTIAAVEAEEASHA